VSHPRRAAAVTGTSSGIGRAIALRLLDDGWQVRGLDQSAATIDHPAFLHVAVDLTKDAAAAARDSQHVDAFVHAAGVLRVGTLGALAPADGELMWRLHVDAAQRIADFVVPSMAERGFGRVVLVGSRVAQGMAGRSQYAATKAALIALARSWAAEVVARGVTVNVVSPAATQTAMLADPSREGSKPKLPPLGRLIRPEEIAALVAFLLGDEAAPITGQDIQVCGGSSLAS
jgi:3-oxoacyl-[acyl-carrier protein] reductase